MKLREIWPEDEWAPHSEALRELGDTYHSSRDWRHLKADGSEIHVLTFGRRVAFDGRDGYLVAVVDITERRKAEARIAHMAHHDGLTNLPNRDYFQDRLRAGVAAEQIGRPAHRRALRRSRPVQERQQFLRSPDGRPPAEAGGGSG